jgi:hypothetical protein
MRSFPPGEELRIRVYRAERKRPNSPGTSKRQKFEMDNPRNQKKKRLKNCEFYPSAIRKTKGTSAMRKIFHRFLRLPEVGLRRRQFLLASYTERYAFGNPDKSEERRTQGECAAGKRGEMSSGTPDSQLKMGRGGKKRKTSSCIWSRTSEREEPNLTFGDLGEKKQDKGPECSEDLSRTQWRKRWRQGETCKERTNPGKEQRNSYLFPSAHGSSTAAPRCQGT